MNLEVQEAILTEGLERSLDPINRWDLLAELEKAHMHLDRINGEHATEAEQQSQWVMRFLTS
jgi:hypothetical protein